MDEKTRRLTTWGIIIAAIIGIIAIASYRRSEMDRLAHAIGYGPPEARIAAVRTLVAKQKLMEALEDQPRWVMDNAVAAIDLLGDDDAYYEVLTCHGVLDAPVQARDQVMLTRLARRGVEVFIEAIQDKDGVARGAAKAPLINIGKALEAEESTDRNTVIDGCMDLLDAWDQYVRDLVRDILAGIALPAVTDRLMPVMQQTQPGPDQSTQEFMRGKATAEAALVTMKVPALQPIIDNLLSSENADVRGNACRVLGAIANQGLGAPIAAADAVVVVEPLLDVLGNAREQWAVQRRAATALGLLGAVAKDNGVVPVLIAHLQDRDEVKAAAVEALGRIGDPIAIEPLVETLVSNRSGATTELRVALTAMGEDAISPMGRALSSPGAEVRRIATEATAEIGGPNAVEPLGNMLKDTSTPIKRVAANALRDIADDRVLNQVKEALEDDDWQVYHAARDALAKVGPAAVSVLVSQLGTKDPRVSSMAKEALTRIGDKALQPLAAALSSDQPEQARWAAIAMGSIGYSAVGPALEVLKNASLSTQARSNAALALGRTGAGDAVEPLLEALKRQDAKVKVQAIKSLAKLADERATEGLVAALSSPSDEVRDTAMDVLRDWRLGGVQSHLLKTASSGDTNAKRRAVILLAELTSVATHELLEELASAEDAKPTTGQQVDTEQLVAAAVDGTEKAKVRARAIHALGYVGGEESLSALGRLLKPGEFHAAGAAVAVARIGSRVAGEPAQGVRPELSQAGETLVDLMLKTDDDQLRAIAAAGVSLMGEQPVWTLIERLEATNDKTLKTWIIATLGAIGKPATDPVLEERGSRKDSPELREWLVSSLPLIGDAQALDLIEHLGAEDQPDEKTVQAGKRILEQIRAVNVE